MSNLYISSSILPSSQDEIHSQNISSSNQLFHKDKLLNRKILSLKITSSQDTFSDCPLGRRHKGHFCSHLEFFLTLAATKNTGHENICKNHLARRSTGNPAGYRAFCLHQHTGNKGGQQGRIGNGNIRGRCACTLRRALPHPCRSFPSRQQAQDI